MTDLATLTTWIDGYVNAWSSNDPDEIGGLWSDEAAYRTEPFASPWRGREAIVENWLARKDEPGQTAFTWRPLVQAGDLAVIQAETTYQTPPRTYSNLWVLRLEADGRCGEFTEWWMKHPRSAARRQRDAQR